MELRDVAPLPPPSSVLPKEKGPLTRDRLVQLWPSIVHRAHSTSPMLGTLLTDATVLDAARDTVTLASPGHAEGLEHKRDAIAKLLGEWAEGPVKVVIGEGGEGKGEESPPPPGRMTEATANLERLKVLRGKDPALGAAVDAMDLELME